MKKLFYLFFLFAAFSFSQINSSFIVHLSKLNLKKEHAVYLSQASTTRDSLLFYKSKYSLQYKHSSDFLNDFENCPHLYKADTNAFNYAAIYFLAEKKEFADRFFRSSIFANEANSTAINIRAVFLGADNPLVADTLLIPAPLRSKFMRYKKCYRKKPVVAGLLSAVVPGLGKLYSGRKSAFFNTLFTHVVFAATGIEAVKKLGLKNPYTICNLALSAVFYSANIYGSYFDVKRMKKEKQKQFLLDATDYFRFRSSNALYPNS
jgi:hypothetical protein